MGKLSKPLLDEIESLRAELAEAKEDVSLQSDAREDATRRMDFQARRAEQAEAALEEANLFIRAKGGLHELDKTLAKGDR